MIQLPKEYLYKIKELGQVFEDTTCYTVMQGIGGSAWVDEIEEPNYAISAYGDFCFFAGKPTEDFKQDDLLDLLKKLHKEKVLFIPETKEWTVFFEDNTNFYSLDRYRLKKRKDPFDRVLLKKYVEKLPAGFQIEAIDEKWHAKLQKEDWGADLCGMIPSAKEYVEHAVGFLVTKDGVPAAGISSYSYYDKGVEIQVDTKKEFRRLGLATILGARFILECMERNLYPNWDAANPISLRTAEKLGYEFDKIYKAFSNMEIKEMKLGDA